MTHNKKSTKREREAQEERRAWENSIKSGYEVIAAMMAISPDPERPITAEDLPSSFRPHVAFLNTPEGRLRLKAWQQLFDDIVRDLHDHVTFLQLHDRDSTLLTLGTIQITTQVLEKRMPKSTSL